MVGGGTVWGQKSKFARFVIRQGRLYGYINASGRIVIKPQFGRALPFSDNLALVKKGRLYGYIDLRGRMAIRPRYGLARVFSSGLAAVRVGKRWGYITGRGKIFIKPKFRAAGDFSEGLAPAFNGRKWGYINTAGRFAIKPKFRNALRFSDGLAAVQHARTRKWGFVNKRGTFVIPAKYASARPFSRKMAPVKFGRKYGYIGKRGRWKIRPRFVDAFPFSQGLAAVKTGRTYGFINTRGKIAIRPKFLVSSNPVFSPTFSAGLAPVFLNKTSRKNNRFAYVNRGGRLVWPARAGKTVRKTPRKPPRRQVRTAATARRQVRPGAAARRRVRPAARSSGSARDMLGYIRIKDKSRRFPKILNKMWPPPRVPRHDHPGITHGSDVVLPPGFNKRRKYPAWIVLPYTGGTTTEMLKNYLGWRKDLNFEQKFRLFLQYLYPNAKVRERKKFVIFLPAGRGSKRDHSWRGFERAMQRYEARAKAFLRKYGKALNIDRSKVVIGGHSLGGDMGWALPLRNPRLFSGAIVMGSRASFRNDDSLRILKRRKFRYFFSIGARDRRVRQAGQAKARYELQRAGVRYAFFSIPRAKHSVILPETPLMAALDYTMLKGRAVRAAREPDPVPPPPRTQPRRIDSDANTGVNVPADTRVTPKAAPGPVNSAGRRWPPSPLAQSGPIRIKHRSLRFPRLLGKTWPRPRVPHSHPGISHGSDVLLPPGFDRRRKYPVWIVLPYTGGTTPAMVKNYIGWRKDLTLEQRFALFLEYVYPDPKLREKRKFVIFLPAGRGSKRDHSWRGFERAMQRYEARAKAFLSRYGTLLNIDRSKVILGGHSLGGDMSWSLPIRNPYLFGGAIVMGSRASYRDDPNLNILRKRGFRYFLSIGAIDKQVRQAGQAKARFLLRQTGVRYVFFKIPGAKHSVILPEAPFMKALEFTMFGNDGGLRVMGRAARPARPISAAVPTAPPQVPARRPAAQQPPEQPREPPRRPAARQPPEQPREPARRPAARQPRERPARVNIRRPPEPLRKTTVVRPAAPGDRGASLEPGLQIPWPEPLIEDDD
ncbi:MAG: WG repeat-containing protein [bacterium]